MSEKKKGSATTSAKNRKRKERRRRQARMTADPGASANAFAALRGAAEEGEVEVHAVGKADGAPRADERAHGSASASAHTTPSDGKKDPKKKEDKKKRKKRGRDADYRSVVEDNRKKIEQFAAAGARGKLGGATKASAEQQLVMGGDLNPLEKRLLADIARQLGLVVAENCGPKRTVRISKPADWEERREEREDEERKARRARGGRPAPLTVSTLPIALRNRFAIDFSLPMPVLESPYFEHYLDLYDPLFHCKSNLDLYLEAINSQGGASKWRNYTGELVQRIIDDVSSKPAYQALAADDLSRYAIPEEEMEKGASENLYKIENSGKYYVSLDFRSANFNSLRYYNSEIVHGARDWVEFLSRYTSYQALLNSKRFRAAVMGKMNHHAQSRIYHSLIHRIYKVLLENRVVEKSKIVCKYTDEIVIQTTKKGYRGLLVQLRKTLDEHVSDIDFIKLEPFRLVRLGPQSEENESDMFVKELLITDDRERPAQGLKLPEDAKDVVFKCVFTRKFPQVFKHYFNMEITEMDRTYVDFDGRFHLMPQDEVWRRMAS